MLFRSVVGEFKDIALLHDFGRSGAGICPAAAVIADEIQAQHGLGLLGHLDSMREEVYAVSVERRVSHPGVNAILRAGAPHSGPTVQQEAPELDRDTDTAEASMRDQV